MLYRNNVEADSLDLPTESNLRPSQLIINVKDNLQHDPIYPDDYNFPTKINYYYNNDEENEKLVELTNSAYLVNNCDDDDILAKTIENYDGVNQTIDVTVQEIAQPKLYFNKAEFKLSLASLIANNFDSIEYTFPLILSSGEYTLRDLYYMDEPSSSRMPYGFNGLSKVRFNTNLEGSTYRLSHNASYPVRNLMHDNTKNGITKDSSIVVDVDIPDITQISNYSITTNGNKNVPIPSGYDAVDSINLNVNVKINLSISDFKLYNENNSAFSFNKQNVNWSYNIGSSQGTYAVLAYFYECENYYKIGLIRVDDGGSYNFTRRSDAIGNYMFESTVSGTVTNGQIKIYCKNKSLLYMYDYGNGTGDRVESEIMLYKENYLITDSFN